MPYETIIYDRKERTGWITLNRPRAANAINHTMVQELREACQSINQEEKILVLVISGGGQSFCSGEDLKESKESSQRETPSTKSAELRMQQGIADAIAKVNCPVIACINGDALGQGLELALACDLRIASQSAHFGFPYASLGLFPRDGGTQRLPRIVGRSKALEMLLTGELIDAAEAHRLGLAHKIVTPQEIVPETEKWAKRIATRAPLSLKYAKEAVHKGLDLTLEQGLRLECDLYLILQTTEDRTEGIQAFLEKRAPHFKGQ